MKRFNSNPSSTQSSILAGNIQNYSSRVESVASLSDDEGLDDVRFPEEDEPLVDLNMVDGTASEDEIKRADKLLYDMFGVNVISLLCKLILVGQIHPDSFVVQSLAYKCQLLVRGKTGVRYKKTWGLFWAGCRNIIKSRGIIPFLDHFQVPSQSQLVKYKRDAMTLCGLEKSTIGRPGLQLSSTELWVNAKSKESQGQPLAVSVCMDGKKIAVSSSEDATEDMGGIGQFPTKEAADIEFDDILATMGSLLKQNDRKSLFTFYDHLSSSSQEIVAKMYALQVLESTNTKKLEKNPNLSKYVHVLKSKGLAGQELLYSFCNIQRHVIEKIADQRNASHLLPQNEIVLLQKQDNFMALESMDVKDDEGNIFVINQMAVNEHLLEINWTNLKAKLKETWKLSRQSKSFKQLLELCYLSSDQAFSACGLENARPVQDMKSIYKQSHTFPSTLKPPVTIDPNVVETFCAIMAPMTFGVNFNIKESGIHVKDGTCSIPDLLVINQENEIEYNVKAKESASHIFNIDLETVAHMVVDSFIVGSRKGALLLQNNVSSLVVSCVPPDHELARSILAFCDSYISAGKCITKRTKEMMSKQQQLKNALISVKERATIIGSYPMISTSTIESLELENQKTSLSRTNLAKILGEVMHGKKRFLAKEARELVAINLTDLSGNPSDSPHTLLAATFLSSSSLKVVGEKCLKEVIEMVEKKNCVCVNVGVDGESIHLATRLPDGTPGTELALARTTLKQLQSFTKESLIKMISRNSLIDIRCKETGVEDGNELEEPIIEDLVANLEDTLTLVHEDQEVDTSFTLEDIETMLGSDLTNVNPKREAELKSYKVGDLRMIGLRHIFPQLKKQWMIRNMGHETISIFCKDGQKVEHSSSTVFKKTGKGFFRTVTFDFAHIINLFRESAATGKLENLGLKVNKLVELSKKEGFNYLEQIIALKNGKLKFDSMNQKCATSLFSQKTVEGLRGLNDFEGAKAVKVISNGLLAMDESGIKSEERVKSLMTLKNYLLEKNDILERLKRPDEKHVTNELFQMTLVSIDSNICTYLNLEFYNPRRKSTSSVESLFGQMMLMTDGCSRLGVRQLHDVLQRLALSSALRLLPVKVRGFTFLGQLKRHMTSYNPESDDHNESEGSWSYPVLKISDGSITPADSCFDKKASKRRQMKGKIRPMRESSFDGNVRKFHKKARL